MATNNNNKTLQQLENLLATYDERGLQLIQNYLNTHTENTQQGKAEEHQSVRKILDQIHELQHHAARMGQLHIVDHHQKAPRILIATPNSLHQWSGGQLTPLPPLPSASIKSIHSLDVFSYTGADGKLWEYASILADRIRMLTLNLNDPKDYSDTNIPGSTVHSSLHVYPNEYYLNERDLGIVEVTFYDGQTKHGPTTITRHSHSSINLPTKVGTYRNFHGRMTFDLSGNQLYIANPSHGISRVDFGQQKPVITDLYDRFPIKVPIGIAFDQNLRLLIVQDAVKRVIYGMLVDKQQSYPSFTHFGQALQLPESALPNATSFTYSCWLKRGFNRSKDWKKQLPDSLLGFYISEDHKEVIIHYHANGEPHTTSFLAPIPASDWFHFSWIKRDEQFEFLINDWSHTIPAPKRIDLNRELPGKEHPLLFCVPGYIAAEVNTWASDLPVNDIRSWRRNWITGAPPQLSGYWHLQVSNQETIWDNPSPAFEDASGHGNNLTGNRTTWQLATSPLDALLPLYYLHEKELSQGLTVDTPAGQIYWCEKLKNKGTRLMRGSSIGHTMPVVLAELDHQVVGLHVESASNDAFEELALAHARRRKAMQEAIQAATHALEQHALDVDAGHEQVLTIQANIQDELTQAAHNRDELTQLLKSYNDLLDEAHRTEKRQERQVAQARLDAIEQARKMVSDAHLRAAAIRREGGQTLINSNQQSQ